MYTLFLIVGSVLLFLGVIDILWTILWVARGGGPVTSYISSRCWKLMRKLFGSNPRLFSMAGPVTVIVTLLTWILLLWAGWTLIFAGGEIALSDTENRGEVTWIDTLYFTGFTLFTLGIGDFIPTYGVWKIATVLASATGMLLITMSASYVVSVLTGVTQKRSFADSIAGVGSTGAELVQQAWNGRDFSNADLYIITYTAQLSTITSQHNAYPILHYYHSEEEKKALTRAVAIFDEALTIFQYGILEAKQPNALLIKNARSSIKSYIDTQESAYVKPAEEAPETPDLAILREAGLPVVEENIFISRVEELTERRRKLSGLLIADAQRWPS